MKMKNSTIRKRVTLYYSTALILITVLILGLFVITAGRQVKAVSKDTIMKAVQNSFDDIDYNRSMIEIADDFDAYRKGVTLIVYDEDGKLLKGSLPKQFPAQTPLSSGGYQEVDTEENTYLIYDLFHSYDNGYGIWVRGIYSMDASAETLRTIIVLLLFAMPLILIIAIWAGIRITKKAFDPVKEITETANSISSGNDLSKRLPQGEIKDELYYLSNTLNEMMERLEKAFRSEKQFTSDVSHELKTPMAVILSECEYVLQENRKAEEYIESIETIQKQCRRTLSLIQQLLQISGTFSTENAVEKEYFDLSVLAESTTDELKKLAEEKGIKLTCSVQPNIEFYGDETLIMRMIINLLTNAVKYSREGVDSFVHLTVSTRKTQNAFNTIHERENSVYTYTDKDIYKDADKDADSTVTISVEDNGIGIKKEDLSMVFNRFYKADKSRTAKSDSFGLGLSMVKWIAEAHGGFVTVKSEAGEGSCFTVTLPLKAHRSELQ